MQMQNYIVFKKYIVFKEEGPDKEIGNLARSALYLTATGSRAQETLPAKRGGSAFLDLLQNYS